MEEIRYILMPTPEEFISLRRQVNWDIPDFESIIMGLKQSLYGARACNNEEIFGMARVVGRQR